MVFDYTKAKNIANCLPKAIKRLNFSVEAVPPKEQEEEQKTLHNDEYTPSPNVTRWAEKFLNYEKDIKDAEKRIAELPEELSNTDRELTNILHEIEISSKCDMYNAWIFVNRIRSNRRKRRSIKDEKLMIDSILSMKVRDFNCTSINRILKGLENRKYTLRIVEEGDNEDCK
jgi:vacuolar-type H+-ATPase subunit I/STV1